MLGLLCFIPLAGKNNLIPKIFHVVASVCNIIRYCLIYKISSSNMPVQAKSLPIRQNFMSHLRICVKAITPLVSIYIKRCVHTGFTF